MSQPRLRDDWRNDRLVRFFMRHVVPIHLDLRKGNVRRHVIITAFVFSVYDRWLLMTAGHCITDIKQYRDHGYEIATCVLEDSLGPTAKHKMPVAINYDDAKPTHIGNHHTWDYGVLFPSDNTRDLLERNEVKAFDERSWATEPENSESRRR